MQHAVIPWVLFQLTHSGTWVGVAAFAQFMPAVLLSPLAGSIADRVPRRRILLINLSLLAGVALILWITWVAGVRSPTVIVLLMCLYGVFSGLNVPAWIAFVADLVPRSALQGAVTLNSAQFSIARAIGPAVGGLLLALGPSWAFLVNAVSFSAVLVALAFIRNGREGAPVGERVPLRHEFRATTRYARGRRGIWTCMMVVTAIGLFGNALFSLLAVFADDVFRVSGGYYGLLAACLGIGAIMATPFAASGKVGSRRGSITGGALVAYGVAIAVFAISPSYWLAIPPLVVAGASYLALASMLNSTIQLQVDAAMRGKVTALYLMCFTASIPLGTLIQGWFVDQVGARPTVATAGLLLVLATVVLHLGRRFAALNEVVVETTGPGAVSTAGG